MSVVSLTRIEPPLHPDGPEKILWDGKTEPEDFLEEELLVEIPKLTSKDKITKGIFAPWFMFKEDFTSIGGHDPLYAPQSKEDSDIFNRFLLNDYELIQTWEGFVYHMTCRGSRFNPTLTEVGKESDEWLKQNMRSTRNFIRKWGHFVKHDKFMLPEIPHKYDIKFNVENGNGQLLNILEPWCDRITMDVPTDIIESYIKLEQPNTQFDLTKRINVAHDSDIEISFDANRLSNNSYSYIQKWSEILDGSDLEIGEFELDIFNIKVNRVKHYEKTLINL